MATHGDTPLARVRDAYVTLLSLEPDDGVIGEVLTCAYLSNVVAFTHEPVWLQVVGPPSSHKTESLRPLMSYLDSISVSSMTANSLISGHRDKDDNDPSLILRLDGKNLIIKDMTTIHSLDSAARDKIFGDLRDAFDGTCSKASGVSGLSKYNARFGVIFAITEVIDAYSDQMQQLGERFLTFRTFRYPLSHTDSAAYIRHVLRVSPNKPQWQADLRAVVAEQFDTIKALCLQGGQPTIPPNILTTLTQLSHILSQLRTSSIKGTPVTGEIGLRISQQLMNLGSVRCVSSNRSVWDDSDLDLCRRIVIDTIPAQRRRIIQVLYHSATNIPHPQPATILARDSRTPLHEMKAILSQYVHTNVVKALWEGRSKTIKYTLHPEFRQMIQTSGLFDVGIHLPSIWSQNKYPPQKKGTS